MLKYIFFWYLTIIRVWTFTQKRFFFSFGISIDQMNTWFCWCGCCIDFQKEAASTAWYLHFSDVALVQNYQFVSVPVCSIQAFPFLPLEYWISNQILKVFLVNSLMAQIKYSIMLWINDNKMSVHHLSMLQNRKSRGMNSRAVTVHVSWWTTWQ